MSASDLQNITSRIETLLQEIRAIESSPSRSPDRSKLLFGGSPERQSPRRRHTFTAAQDSPYDSASILPSQNIDDTPAQMRKQLQMENEKILKLENALRLVQEELKRTRSMADDASQSKRLALALLKQLHSEYTKLQQKYQQSIKNTQHRESIRRSQDSALADQERKLSSLSEQLQFEISKRLDVETQLSREKNSQNILKGSPSETIRQEEQQTRQIRNGQLEEDTEPYDELMFHDCEEQPEPQTLEKKELQKSENHKKPTMETENLLKKTSDKSVNASDTSYDADELIQVKNRCAELEKQLSLTTCLSQELSAVRKHCSELESKVKENAALGSELNEYQDQLQKNVQQLYEVKCAFVELQDTFKSAQTESNMRLEEKEKLITTLKENESLMITENETLREIVKDLNALAQSYLERIQDLWNKKIKLEEGVEQKTEELKEKEKCVCESDCELKAMCKKCSQQEGQIKELKKTIDLLEDKYGKLTVESATYACENVWR